MVQRPSRIIGDGRICRIKTGIFGSAIGEEPTDMMGQHLQRLQKAMAWPVVSPWSSKTETETFGWVVMPALDLAVTMVLLSRVLLQKTASSTTVYGPFWKIRLEIFGWVRGRRVSPFTMGKRLLRIRSINASLQRTEFARVQGSERNFCNSSEYSRALSEMEGFV